jgi:hypothetical protein
MSPSFGTYIRGLRMRFYWVHNKGCFIRMSPLNYGATRIELYPVDTDFSESRTAKKSKDEHYIWWHDEKRDCTDLSILETIPCLKNLKAIKRSVVFDINDNGQIIY